jgi:N-acyl-L-homoserine lactone synthetase
MPPRRRYHPASQGPRNLPLDSAQQAFAALGWRDGIDAVEASRFVSETTASAERASFNPNTATRQALQSVLAIDAREADSLIAVREKQLVLSMDEVAAITGSARTDLHVRATPARRQRLTITVSPSSSEGIYVYVSRLSIAEDAEEGPISRVRLESPMRAQSRERARNESNVQADILPFIHDVSAP